MKLYECVNRTYSDLNELGQLANTSDELRTKISTFFHVRFFVQRPAQKSIFSLNMDILHTEWKF